MRLCPSTLAIACLLGLVVPASGVSAQEDCDGPVTRGPLEVTPLPGPFPVTLGAPVRVRYSEGYFSDPSIGAIPEESIRLYRADTSEPVLGTIQVIGDSLTLVPDRAYEPRTDYLGVADGIDGSLDIRFTTGDTFDTGPPELGSIQSMSAARVDESCDAPDGGYRIDVLFRPAVDDGPPGDIEYLLYLSRGPEVEAPELRARVRNLTPSEVVMAFVIDPSEAVSPICVTVHAIDGVGNVDDDSPPFCDDPIKGNFFAPACAVTAAGVLRPDPGRGALGSAPLGLLVMMGLLLVIRRSRRKV